MAMRRYFLYILLLDFVILGASATRLSWTQGFYAKNEKVRITMYIINDFSGLLLSLYRLLSEPHIYTIWQLEVSKLCCHLQKQKSIAQSKKYNFKNGSLSTFLNQALSKEYVFLTLVGINEFMERNLNTTQEELNNNVINIDKNREKTVITYELKFDDK